MSAKFLEVLRKLRKMREEVEQAVSEAEECVKNEERETAATSASSQPPTPTIPREKHVLDDERAAKHVFRLGKELHSLQKNLIDHTWIGHAGHFLKHMVGMDDPSAGREKDTDMKPLSEASRLPVDSVWKLPNEEERN